MTRDEEISRGERARQVLQDDMFREAMTAIKAEIYNKFLRTTFDQKEEREELWRKSQAVENLEGYLERVMISGQMAHKTKSK